MLTHLLLRIIAACLGGQAILAPFTCISLFCLHTISLATFSLGYATLPNICSLKSHPLLVSHLNWIDASLDLISQNSIKSS